MTRVGDLIKLDIGCGHSPSGDVNVDLYVKPTHHRSADQGECKDSRLNVKNIPNFVRADACNLPLRDDLFDEVSSSHTIEHVRQPYLMVKEMVRVAKFNSTITVRCPHRYASRKGRVFHINSLNITWLRKAFTECGLSAIAGRYTVWRYIPGLNAIIDRYTAWRYFPQRFILIFEVFRLPHEIEVTAKKRRLTS